MRHQHGRQLSHRGVNNDNNIYYDIYNNNFYNNHIYYDINNNNYDYN